MRPTKDAKDVYSKADSLAVWGASAWTRELAGMVLAAELAPLPAGTTYRQTSQERALHFLCKQYGNHLIGAHNELGGWEELGLQLGEIIRKQRLITG